MSKPRPLLDRQVGLIAYLTSGAAIFDDGGVAAARDPALQGIDRGSLHLEARLSHNKRMEKITTIFPKTCEILGSGRDAVVRAFAEMCPPAAKSRMENARQFRDFLFARADGTLQPAHVRDVAACEFACATARVRGGDQVLQTERAASQPRGWVRRNIGVVLLRCEYDLRTVFEDGSDGSVPTKRDAPLAISFPPDAASPQIFELAPVVFDLLARMDDWTDPATLGNSPEMNELLRDLAQCGLMEPPP
jgi:hypothetical protein